QARAPRKHHEISRFEGESGVAIDGQTTAAVQHRAEARLTESGVADAPTTGAAVPPREHSARPKQCDDVGEWVIHGVRIEADLFARRAAAVVARAFRFERLDDRQRNTDATS